MIQISTDLILIGLLIVIGLPVLQYDFRMMVIIMIIFLLIFPDKRDTLYKSLGIENLKKKSSSSHKETKQINILYEEGGSILKELKMYGKKNPSVYLSIKLTWKKFMNISDSIFNNKIGTYQHHLFSTLVDQRKYILNQMSAMILSLDTVSIRESTLTKERTLPLDNHVRILIRKMSTVLDMILEIIKNHINDRWNENPYVENSPVEWGMPQAYNHSEKHQTF
jgi:hypothetical protein